MSKGGDWELHLSKQLSLWVSRGERRDLFCRNITSGAFYTAAMRAGRDPGIPGDIMAATDDPRAHAFLRKWMVEAKHWRSLNFQAAMWKSNGDFYAAMTKAESQAQTAGRHCLMIAKQNYQPAICLLPKESGLERQLMFHGTMHHVLWKRRTIAIVLEDLLKLDPEPWLT